MNVTTDFVGELVHPMSSRAFWTGTAHFTPRVFEGQTWLRDLFSTERLEQILRTQNFAPFLLNVVKNSVALAPQELFYSFDVNSYPAYLLNHQAVIRNLAEGSVLTLLQAHLMDDNLITLTKALTMDTGAKVHINVYYGWASSCGLSRHADTHHVFVVQCEGEKSWQVYGLDKKLLIEQVLQAGDVLYMPPGHEHVALAAARSHTLHLTIGLRFDSKEGFAVQRNGLSLRLGHTTRISVEQEFRLGLNPSPEFYEGRNKSDKAALCFDHLGEQYSLKLSDVDVIEYIYKQRQFTYQDLRSAFPRHSDRVLQKLVWRLVEAGLIEAL